MDMKNTAWKVFEKTGDIESYLLYREGEGESRS